MSNDFLGRELASLRDTLVALRDDLKTSRNREFAACAGRVLARMQTDLTAAPALAAARLVRWRRLNDTAPVPETAAPGQGEDALHALYAAAAQVGRSLDALTIDTLRDEERSAVTAGAWFKEAVSATRDFLQAYESALPPDEAVTSRPDASAGTQLERLSRYLARRYPALPADVVRSLRVVPGGRGKETSLVELAPNDLLPSRLVLRRDLSLSVTGASAYAEFPLLQAVDALGMPVPKPLLAEKDPTHLGGTFILMTEIEDAKAGGELFAELNDLTRLAPTFAPRLVGALATLHTLRHHPSGTELAGHATGGTDALDMVRGFQQMFRTIAHKPPLHVATDLGFAWLLANPLPKNRPLRLVHGDVGLHNVLVRNGELAAILDWELAHLGDPAEDIAYAWSPLLRHLLTWEEFTQHYRDQGGDADSYDRHAVAWYGVWAHTRNSVYVALHYDWAATGQRKDIECFNAGTDFFARTQYYIALELDEALARISTP
jgi:aminoglycoside phosphotransferase (APT) family kinase protein